MKKILTVFLMICLMISIGCTKTKYITKTKVLIPPLPEKPSFEKVEGEKTRHNGEYGIFYNLDNYKNLQKNLEKLNLYIDLIKINYEEYEKIKKEMEKENASKEVPEE